MSMGALGKDFSLLIQGADMATTVSLSSYLEQERDV